MALDRFMELDEGELKKFLDRKDSESTKKTVKAAVAVFQHYLEAKGKDLQNIESSSTEDCDDLLRKFYVETRKEDGSRYAKKSMVTLRYGLQKHFLRTREQDIINDKTYSRSNEMFKAVLMKLKEDGIGECSQKVPVTPEDMAVLYNGSAFNIHTPEGLQRKVMFEYLYYFCSRGRENLRGLKTSDFVVGMDSSGREYVAVRSKPNKNCRGDELPNEQRMYDKPGDPNCPVATFKKYVEKLHTENSNFWQRPKRNVHKNDSIWYDNFPVGKNALYTFMQRLSQDYHLSTKYTNHCVRATSITALDHNGVEVRHIMSVSGHKNESSVKAYSCRISDDKKREMSDILSEHIAPPASKCAKMCTMANDRRSDDKKRERSDILSEHITPSASKCVKTCTMASTDSRRSMNYLMDQSGPAPPALISTVAHPELQEHDDVNIDRPSAPHIDEQQLSSLGTNASPAFKEVEKDLTNETKMDIVKERERIAAVLRAAVLSLCRLKYTNPIEVDALICVALTPTDNHVVKIHEKLGVFGNTTSGLVSTAKVNDVQNTCNVSNTWSMGPKSKRKRNVLPEDTVNTTQIGSDRRTCQTNVNSENFSGVSTIQSSSEVVKNSASNQQYPYLGQTFCSDGNMYLSTVSQGLLQKGGVANSVRSILPKIPAPVTSGWLLPIYSPLTPMQSIGIPPSASQSVPVNVAETSISRTPMQSIGIPPATSQNVPVAETSICRKGKLDQCEIQRTSPVIRDDDDDDDDDDGDDDDSHDTLIKEENEDSLDNQNISDKEQDSSTTNDESNSNQTIPETLPGGVVIKEEPTWNTVEDTVSKWPTENEEENSSEADKSQTPSTCNPPKQTFQSQPKSPEVPLEMSVTSIKEEPEDSDISEPEMEMDIDVDSSQFDLVRNSDSFSISDTATKSILSKVLKGNRLAEAYKSVVSKDTFSSGGGKEGIPTTASQPNTGEEQDNSLVYRLPFVSFQDLIPGEVSGEKTQERDNVAVSSLLKTSTNVEAALTPTEHATSSQEKRNSAKGPYSTRLSSGRKHPVNYTEMTDVGSDFDVSDGSKSPRSELDDSYICSPRLEGMLEDDEEKS